MNDEKITAVQTYNLTKTFDEVVACDDISLMFEKGRY